MAGIVEFQKVGLRYGRGAETLSDLDFVLERGSFHLLTGPSGAGKSSLLSLITLARRPSRGLIRLFGEDVVTIDRARLPAFRRRIGIVYQDFRLIPSISVFENVALPLRIVGAHPNEIDASVTELLAWVGLDARARALPSMLSGGEQQRVAIARAVVTRPDLIVADEPTGNVDPEMAGRIFHLLESLNRLGTTVLIATHDIHLIGRAPQAAMMRLNRGTLDDPTGALRHPPARQAPYP
ncbi:cell division transport system ATP-binding protein [Sphingomonas vulcanisoli]|uniref:Cell division ATP-binding protein FtsE n=1 Tax=Sphingomonas vulcanisoli TaxID=1658060 RepID=A0ABX0TP49_9SPHN|nr:cell division ATP-binding protein FtsE [Sphingomonas vulcanisoli]NIJ06888.1 cell division transport system ATP-binding protein [Sphingomonas vulcanisoli]